MRTFYWVSGISSWSYVDTTCKPHGRIDWFENIEDMGYWWQTAHESGMCFTLDSAKRGVENAMLRRAAEQAASLSEQQDGHTYEDERGRDENGEDGVTAASVDGADGPAVPLPLRDDRDVHALDR
jgi:hypothetical protein